MGRRHTPALPDLVPQIEHDLRAPVRKHLVRAVGFGPSPLEEPESLHDTVQGR